MPSLRDWDLRVTLHHFARDSVPQPLSRSVLGCLWWKRPLNVVCFHPSSNRCGGMGNSDVDNLTLPIRKDRVSWYFIFFFISGFCSVLYELVWLRLSMAQFGVTTAMVSIVLSIFMGGLGLGSWAGGAWTRRHGGKVGFPALRLYAAIELLIGVSGILVPYELRLGHNILEGLGSSSSGEYYVVSGLWVALTLIPWCALMGATIPVAMLAIERMFPKE